MLQYIGVKPGSLTNLYQGLKKELLLFDFIYINYLNFSISQLKERKDRSDHTNNVKFIINEFEWLQDQGLIVDDHLEQVSEGFGRFNFADEEEMNKRFSPEYNWLMFHYLKNQFESGQLAEKAHELKARSKVKEANQFYSQAFKLNHLASEYHARARSLHYNKPEYGVIATPLVTQVTDLPKNGNFVIKKAEIINVLLKQIPIPDETNAWEDIINFRNDSNSISKFRGLRTWVTDMDKSNFNIHEIEERLEYQLDEYEECLKLHKLRTTYTTFQTIVLFGAEFIENAFKLKLSNAIKPFFDLKKGSIDLLEAEFNAKNKELAYIYFVKNKYNKK